MEARAFDKLLAHIEAQVEEGTFYSNFQNYVRALYNRIICEDILNSNVAEVNGSFSADILC